ncbi:hypothetical protein SAMN05444171_1090 [Bradyrhizobium lablabi]|uniref:Uncharacterized protein n=2 Tax=Bradyrhizobium TaxID=374 RepID=A0ABY0Q7V6_9BRAD|nr:hypothetical protein SAMN05444163_6069 [Bradyrhizobium ottawaense]SEC30020.1 hypothetical protein SAMN05444171_1090 [Bradyrhizobium lablabi]
MNATVEAPDWISAFVVTIVATNSTTRPLRVLALLNE